MGMVGGIVGGPEGALEAGRAGYTLEPRIELCVRLTLDAVGIGVVCAPGVRLRALDAAEARWRASGLGFGAAFV